MKRVGARGKDRAEMAMVKIGNMNGKKKIMEKRKRPKGRKEKIEDNLI